MGVSAHSSWTIGLIGLLIGWTVAVPAHAQTPTERREPLKSVPINEHYFQYGAAIAAESVASPGGVCPETSVEPCILGSGAGLAIRAGYRTRGSWYLGGAYEFARMNPSNLLRLAILQQLRAETRFYFRREPRLVPYAAASLGGMLYGNEWGVDTGGLTAMLGAGVEFQVSRTSLLGATLGYRPLVFRRWTDGVGEQRANGLLGFGVAHLVAVELQFEVRDPRPRW